ncbi:MAG: 5-oxoprolinase subunit PxpB [Pyrinomonadaceae bacterium]
MMKKSEPRIFPLGDNALTVSFGNEISPELNREVLDLADHFAKKPFPGLIELVPCYSSLTVFYDIGLVRKNSFEFSSAFDAVRKKAEKALENMENKKPTPNRLLEIPVSFDPGVGPDLEDITRKKNLSTGEFLKIFTSNTYRVYMLGFLPGFAYMGEVDPRIAFPRKKTPRKRVPAGSVGIAGSQTGIYPIESPGGWQIIGRTEIKLFSPEKEDPTFFQCGDLVKFYDSNR